MTPRKKASAKGAQSASATPVTPSKTPSKTTSKTPSKAASKTQRKTPAKKQTKPTAKTTSKPSTKTPSKMPSKRARGKNEEDADTPSSAKKQRPDDVWFYDGHSGIGLTNEKECFASRCKSTSKTHIAAYNNFKGEIFATLETTEPNAQ